MAVSGDLRILGMNNEEINFAVWDSWLDDRYHFPARKMGEAGIREAVKETLSFVFWEKFYLWLGHPQLECPVGCGRKWKMLLLKSSGKPHKSGHITLGVGISRVGDGDI